MTLEIEALQLAENNCVGRYTLDHILELRKLAKAGLVRHVDTERSAYYVLTKVGRARLEMDDG